VGEYAGRRGSGAHRLLCSVLANDAQAVEEVRGLANRLQNEASLRREIEDFYRRRKQLGAKQDMFHILGSWQILARMREALKLAERWLDFREKRAQARIEVQILRQDGLDGLLPPAQKDLDALAGEYAEDHAVTTATLLCRHCLDSLRALSRSGREGFVEPQELASGEIAKQPQLKLDPLWMPSAAAVDCLGSALLALFEDDHPVATGETPHNPGPPPGCTLY